MKQKYHQNSLQKRDEIVLVLQFSPRDFSLSAPSPGKHCQTFWDPLFQFNLTNRWIAVFNFHITWLNCQHKCLAGVQLSSLKSLQTLIFAHNSGSRTQPYNGNKEVLMCVELLYVIYWVYNWEECIYNKRQKKHFSCTDESLNTKTEFRD